MPSKRNEVLAVLSRASPVRWGEMQARLLRPRRVRPAEKSRTGCAGAGRTRLGRQSGVGTAVRFAVGAKGSHNQKPPPGPPRPPPSHCFPAHYSPHYWSALVGIGRIKILPLSKGSNAVSREIPGKCAESRVCGRPPEVHRSPQLPSPSGLLPMRRTQNEPMLRKGNVLEHFQ